MTLSPESPACQLAFKKMCWTFFNFLPRFHYVGDFEEAIADIFTIPGKMLTYISGPLIGFFNYQSQLISTNKFASKITDNMGTDWDWKNK